MSDKIPSKRKQQPPKKQIQRKRSRRPPSKSSSNKKQRQQYTELSAISHILSDQVHKHALENPLSVGELRHLEAWDHAIETHVENHNALVLENVKLTADYKKSCKKISSLRDDLVVLRASTRRFKDETSRLDKQYKQHTEESRVVQGASRFLSAVEKIGKACRDVR